MFPEFPRGDTLHTVPSLTPAELQAARVASGNLGGRPRKPTVTESREAALAELVPPSIVRLKQHIESDAPDAWKAGIRVLELAFARTDNEESFTFPTSIEAIEALSWKQLTFLATTLTGESMDEKNGGVAVIETNGARK
jgi:hypothetical protein